MLDDDLRDLKEATRRLDIADRAREHAQIGINSDIQRLEEKTHTGTGLSIEASFISYKFRIEALESEAQAARELKKFNEQSGKYSRIAVIMALVTLLLTIARMLKGVG